MSDGAYALIGVVIGAFATGGVQATFELRRERQAVRVAARLICEELARNMAIVGMVLEDEVWLPAGHPKAVIRQTAWEENKATLAKRKGSRPWAEVSLAYTDLTSFGGALEHKAGRPIDAQDGEHLADSLEVIQSAIDGLVEVMDFDED
jgi:hypothetical protein